MSLFQIFSHLSMIQGLVSDVEDLVSDLVHKQPVNWQKFLNDLLETAKALESAKVISIGGWEVSAVVSAISEAQALVNDLLPKGPAPAAPVAPPAAPGA